VKKEIVVSLSLFAAAIVGTSVCLAGSPFDGTWESQGGLVNENGKWIRVGGTTVTFHSDGGKISGTIREYRRDPHSFETRPCGPNGVQWFESGGGLSVVYCATVEGNTLTISMIGGDSTGRSSSRSTTYHRVSK